MVAELNNNKMDNLDVNAKFKLISTNLNSIPTYDGNGDALLGFLERIDSMVPILDSFPVDFKILLMGNIKDKIVSNARRSLLINGNADTWPEIKKILIDNHGEKNSVDELIDKIRSCRCDSTIENFYKKLNTFLCRLNNALYFSDNKFTEINYESNGRIALNSFKYGLPEPVKSIIVSRNPKNLKEAYDIIKTNGYLNYNNQSNLFNPNKYAEKNRNTTNRNVNVQQQYSNSSAGQCYNNKNSDGQHYRNSNYSSGQQNNNSYGRYYSNNNPDRFQQQQGQQHNNSHPNFSVQSRQTYNNSGQTYSPQSQYRRTDSNYLNSLGPNVNQNFHSNKNPSQSSVEPMELGVNENCQNFQLDAGENYLI